jgi:nucleoid-associated protein YgaU
MSLHESRRSPARRIDDVQLLQGLLTQRLYVNEHDRQLLRVLLAATPQPLRTTQRAPRRGARHLRASGAALALGGALALTFADPLLPTIAASPAPVTWITVADHAAENSAPAADDALLRALMNQVATASQAVVPADQAPASDALLRALLNRTATASQTVTPAEQTVPQIDNALVQAELIAGETLVIPPTQAANAVSAARLDSAEQQAVRYHVVRRGDTLSGIAQLYYGNATLWRTIFNANTDKIRDPHWIYPDQQFVIPPAPATASPPPATGNPSPGSGTYTVQPGDTLSGIAAYVYRNGNAWQGIFQANRDKITNANLIFPGQVLKIP